MPELRSLDASLNHIVARRLDRPGQRLDEVVLANNQLKILESLAPLGRSLRHLDVSLNDLESLAGSNPADGSLANLPAAPGRRLEDKYYPGDIGFDALGDRAETCGPRRDGDQGAPERPPSR